MFLLQLSSAYRQIDQYPLSTDFVVLTNPTPPDSNLYRSPSLTNLNVQIYIQNPILYLYRWVGNTRVPVTLPYTLPNNAMVGEFTRYTSLRRILLPSSFIETYQLKIERTNYFTGLLFYLFTNTLQNKIVASAVIVFYDPITHAIILESDLPSTFFSSNPSPPYSFTIVNPSGTYGNNINILGSNTFLSIYAENYISDLVLKNGPSNKLWIQNVTKGWAYEIESLLENDRVAITKVEFPSYDTTDLIQIREKDPMSSLYEATVATLTYTLWNATAYAEMSVVLRHQYYGSSLFRFHIETPGKQYTPGVYQVYPLPGAVYGWTPTILATVYVTTVSVDDGRVLDIVCQSPGNLYITSKSYFLSTTGTDYSQDVSATIMVDSVSFAVGVQSLTPHIDEIQFENQTYLLYAPNSTESTQQACELPYAVFYTQGVCISRMTGEAFFFYQPYQFQLSENRSQQRPLFLIPQYTTMELIPLYQRTVGLTAPIIGYNQPVCYRIRLLSLSIPNQPIRGFTVLPTFFPYFILEIYNTSGLASNVQAIYSNNPHTSKATFICQIANPRNEIVSNYLVVHSLQTSVIKWLPTDHIHFRIALPNGETLQYVEDELNASILATSPDQFAIRSLFGFYTQKGVSVQLQFTLEP